MVTENRLNLVFAALSDPTRRAILERLSQGQVPVGELAQPFNMSLQAISKHLKVLEKANLIMRTKEAQWRWCQLEPEALKLASDWLDQYQHFWEMQLDSLELHLQYQQESTNHDKSTSLD